MAGTSCSPSDGRHSFSASSRTWARPPVCPSWTLRLLGQVEPLLLMILFILLMILTLFALNLCIMAELDDPPRVPVEEAVAPRDRPLKELARY